MEAKIISQYWGREITDHAISRVDEITRKNLTLYSMAVAASININPGSSTDLLRRTLEIFELSVDEKVFSKLDNQDAFEIWSIDGKFIASSNQFYSLTSWSIDDLLTRERSELFTRDLEIQNQIDGALATVVQSGKIADNPCPPHVVHELKVGAKTVMVNMKSFAPVFNNLTNSVCGVLAIVRFSSLSQ